MGVFFKRVLMPITVSNTDYCWGQLRICGHFDNEGGHPRCDLNVDVLRYDKEGYVPKPQKCLDFPDNAGVV